MVNAELSPILRIFGKKFKRNYLLDPGINRKVSLFLPCSLGQSGEFLETLLKLYELEARKLENDLYFVVGNAHVLLAFSDRQPGCLGFTRS